MSDVTILGALVLKAALDALAPDFIRATRNGLTLFYDSAAAIRDRVAAMLDGDVAIIQRPAVDALATAGSIVPDSVVTLARSGVGVAVPTGRPKPDVPLRDNCLGLGTSSIRWRVCCRNALEF